MTATITLFESAAVTIATAFAATAEESVAFGFAGPVESLGPAMVIAEAVVVPAEGFRERSPGHFRLEPRYVAEITHAAVQRNRTLVIIHSHPFGSTVPRFSPVDERMHGLLMPGLLQQLGGPVGSLVWSPGGWSGRLWRSPGEGEPTRIRLIGRRIELSAGENAQAIAPRFARQTLVLGEAAQRLLRAVRVGIVGLGGTGSVLAEQLAHIGVSDFVLVDPDVVEESNLSRLVGAVSADRGRAKVEVAARMIGRISADARVATYVADVRVCDATRAMSACDVIFCCTDSHASRALLTRLPFQYGVALIDVGTLLRPAGTAYADVRLVTPTTACLDCQRALDPARVALETQSPDQRALARQFGYAPGTDEPVPAILPLNAIAVSLGVLRLIDLLRPWLSWEARVTLEVSGLEALQRPARKRPKCLICAGSLVGAGDAAPVPCLGTPPS
jgi:molybdopterin-synthase adenylyltransferase